MYESTDRMVSHPGHYLAKNGMEVIDVIEAFTEDLRGIEATDTGNIIKYACRWKNKNGVQDLKKIMWYCQHLIDHLEEKEIRESLEEKVNNYGISIEDNLGKRYKYKLTENILNDSIECINKLVASDLFEISFLTHVNSLTEGCVKVEYLRNKFIKRYKAALAVYEKE